MSTTPAAFLGLRPGSHHLPCPECGGDHKRESVSVTVRADGSGTWFCHRCNWAGGWSSRADRMSRLPDAEPQHHRGLSDWGRQLWNECQPIAGTASSYLRARRCRLPPQDGDLRWHPRLLHKPSSYAGPALVGLVTHATTGKAMTLHRTWIEPGGAKAAVDPPRMLLAGHRKTNGVIRLWRRPQLGRLAIAEGIETALSVDRDWPAWACIDADNMAALPFVAGVSELAVVADNDAHGKGLRAAREVGRRYEFRGVCVRLWCSPHVGEDLNDYVRREAEERQ